MRPVALKSWYRSLREAVPDYAEAEFKLMGSWLRIQGLGVWEFRLPGTR